MMTREIGLVAIFVVGSVLPLTVPAHGTEGHAKASNAPISTDEHPFGVEGDPRKANRTIAVSMSDAMRYTPSEIRVRQGQTVTLVIHNKGKLKHELVIGSEDELKQHAEMMRKNPDMHHDEPYMTHVAAGGTQRMTWRFTHAGTFYFGCLVPGHFEAGMKGTIVVAASST